MIVIHPIAGKSWNGIVGKFTMPPLMTPTPIAGSSAIAVAPVATIAWGDGGTSAGQILPDTPGAAGAYNVFGTHTYKSVGQYKIHILVTLGPIPGPGPQPLAPTSPTGMFPTYLIADIWSLADVTAGTTTIG